MYSELQQQLENSQFLRKGMLPDITVSGEKRWKEKEVSKRKKIEFVSASLNHQGPGHSEISYDYARNEAGSLLIQTPTSLPVKKDNNRAYGISQCMIGFEKKDLSAFNRLSIWVYIDAPGFHAVYLEMSIHNKGEFIMPKPGRFEGTHHPCLTPGQWHHVVWEIPYIYRDCVDGVSLGVPLLGSLPNTATELKVYFADLSFEVVEEENYLGFNLRHNSIAYCHSGYREGAVKEALIQHSDSSNFQLLNVEGQVVYEAEAQKLPNDFKKMDFTSFRKSGWYTLRIGDINSRPFAIGSDAYLSAAWKTLNFFYLERCGADIPGVHTACHLDVLCVHPDGRTLPISGGWHDAGDVSQGLDNTVESASAMLDLAAAIKEKETSLYVRLLEEARWGIDWIIRTRFGDGYRNTGCLIGIWTNNVHRDYDDIRTEAKNNASSNFNAAAVCAKAAGMYTDDSVFSAHCQRVAIEDFAFGVEELENILAQKQEIVLFAQASIAGYELFALTGEDHYLAFAAKYARLVIECQQLDWREDFEIPLSGFFYESRTKSRILAYFHRSYEHAPMQALSRLYQIAPNHPDALLWKRSMELYANYIKATAHMVEPYGVLPNAIYEVNNCDFTGLYHEGDNSVGQPTMEEYNEQVLHGIRLNATHYIRRFPVAYQFRGFHATLMGKAKAIAFIDEALQDQELVNIATRQVEWMLGFNPFAVSSVYGEGYDYHPLYVAFSDQLVGAVPVGFETFENLDEPFFPMQNAPTYKEVWVHTTCRLMWLIADLNRS
ncbi:glycoside hydrolase family 9 protein [Paenibacillus endoradicis]|uniref:glycoside hydrolase family 9 protein n=1 Tax=Paenibacillus endoradicis TaxID=2972487 RepID=UPI0021590B33|nr:glycoside hydrolase family 9 protein [Paenibacillus endoradicis]MCR8660406.1 glycoside hydrolase family 9 protein [Paenibacillus endoradicis]